MGEIKSEGVCSITITGFGTPKNIELFLKFKINLIFLRITYPAKEGLLLFTSAQEQRPKIFWIWHEKYLGGKIYITGFTTPCATIKGPREDTSRYEWEISLRYLLQKMELDLQYALLRIAACPRLYLNLREVATARISWAFTLASLTKLGGMSL